MDTNPPTINPRLSTSHSNEVGDAKNYSSQVNSYPVAASQNLSWAPQHYNNLHKSKLQ